MTAITQAGSGKKTESSALYEGKLYLLLVAKLPSIYIHQHVNGDRIDTLRLSKVTGNARFTIYRWFNTERLSLKAIRSLLAISNDTDDEKKKGALTKEDLLAFALDL
jgi:hypothetical protein